MRCNSNREYIGDMSCHYNQKGEIQKSAALRTVVNRVSGQVLLGLILVMKCSLRPNCSLQTIMPRDHNIHVVNLILQWISLRF